MDAIVIHKGRDVILPVSFPYDVSTDTFRSQIRAGTNKNTYLIAEWSIAKVNDGSDGLLYFTLDSSVTATIVETFGYMDIKRINNGEQYNATNVPIPVSFVGVVTE